MPSTKLAFVGVAVLLLQASWCAVAQDVFNSAVMSLTSFEEGEDDPTACDGKYHSDGEQVVALSTQWFNGGSMCHKHIYVTYSPNSHEASMVLVEVVDECDTQNGCKANSIAATKRVWDILKVDTSLGEVDVTWKFAY